MRVMIITCSPNKDGLTEACGAAAKQGVESGKGEAVMVRVNDLKIAKCQACDNGWGTCLGEHVCQVEDDFQTLHKAIGEVDGYVVITPVYWGDLSESAKAFFDRLRRCEAKAEKSKLQNKPLIAVAAAGGSGNGTITCLSSMDRLISHLRAERCDLVGVTQRNRSYMLEAIRVGAEQMVAAKA